MTAAERYIEECRKWHEAHKDKLKRRKPWRSIYPVPACYTDE